LATGVTAGEQTKKGLEKKKWSAISAIGPLALGVEPFLRRRNVDAAWNY
jgi:hypothetical protein